MPPSIIRTWPVICPERDEEDMITTWPATSSGVATFFSGVLTLMQSSVSASGGIRSN